jgi:guanylate kinase
MSGDPDDNAGRGRLLVLAAPSGAGKTTLVRALLRRRPDVKFSVSYTTRKPRDTEVDGRDYFFVTDAEFRRMIEEDAFLEYARVFDHWYGTGRQHVERMLERGESVVLEIDWQGARQVRRRAPGAVTVFVLPPSLAELEKRLRGRATDSRAAIERRLRDARSDMEHWREFDFAVINADVDEAADALAAIIGGHGRGHETAGADLRARVDAILASSAADAGR